MWASSETTLGLPFDTPPRYAPVDEDHYPVPTSTYALSKVASETIAGHIAGWSGIPYIALRFSNIMAPEDYQMFPTVWDDPSKRKWNLWGYIDQRDAAQSCRPAPGVKLTRDVGEFGTPLAIDRAREVLGFAPARSWRDHVSAE